MSAAFSRAITVHVSETRVSRVKLHEKGVVVSPGAARMGERIPGRPPYSLPAIQISHNNSNQ